MPRQQPRQRSRRRRARYGPPSIEKALGALPVVASFCRRLDLAGIVDRVCPIREVATLTHGQVIEVLVANRLTSPTPLRRVEDWARAWAVEEVFGIPPQALNDDRIGRAWTRSPQAGGHRRLGRCPSDRRLRPAGRAVALGHDLDLAVRRLRPTRGGGYRTPVRPSQGPPPRPQADPDRPWGQRRRRRARLPRAYDGGAGEVAQVAEAMRALPKLAGPRRLLLVGDSKLVSYANLGAIMAAGVDFIAPASKTYVPAEVLAALEVQAATPVGYVAERDQGKPPGQRGSYRVVEDTMPISGRRTTDPVLRVRRVLVWSSARAGAAATARARKLDRARDDLQRLQRGLGSRHYPTIDKVHARLAAIARSRRVTGLLRAQVGTGQDSGKPTLTWWFDPDALAAEAASDGWYALLTNLDPAQADAAGVLARSKGQEVVERRYGRSRGH